MTFAPRWLTPHRAVLLGLLALTVCAFGVSAFDDEFVSRPAELAAALVVSVVVSLAVSALGGALVRVPPGSDSWAITALILFFVLPSGTDSASLTTIAVGAAAAAASKYVLAWRRRLIVNPAVAGAVTCYALAYAGVGSLRYPSWWIASDSLLWPMVIIGALIVTAIARWQLVATFLVVSVITIVSTAGGDPQLSLWLVSSPMFFVAAVMLPEPLTSPPRALGRVAYAAGVGFLMYCGMSVEVTSAYTLEFVPEIALLFGCLFTFVVRLAAGSAVRAVIDVSAAESLADRTWLTRSAEVSAAGFLPGQWASLSAPSWSALLWGRTRRVFSFVNAPGQPTEFAFTANEPVSDFKRDLIEGRTRRIYLDDVGGDFALPRSPLATRSPLVLIASGIGITPIVSMVRTLDARQLAGCTVIHVVRTADRATFGDDLAEARAAGAQVVVIESAELADGLDSETLTGLLGEAERSGDQRRPHYFVSGNPEFVRRTSAAIRRSDPATRTNRIRLHRDAFTGY